MTSQYERGAIHTRQRATQGRDFTGLLYGNITPTDLDGLIDFQDRVWIFIEVKYGATPVPFGQRLALERLADAVAESGRAALAIIAEHDTPAEKDIDVANCRVREYRSTGEWRALSRPVTVRDLIDEFRKRKP